MTHYQPRNGDRVRVVLEGKALTHGGGFYVRQQPGYDIYVDPSAPHVVSVERLPDPEPKWGPAVVRDANGDVYVACGGRWWTAGQADLIPDTGDQFSPRRPLTRLVPEGDQ